MAEGDRDGEASVAGRRRVARSNAPVDVCGFVGDIAFDDLPADVVAQAQRCILDLIGVAAAGSRTRSSAITNAYAASQMCGADRDARILFDGRRASLAGAAFAGAATIDAFDAHDGHPLTKGHAGAAILPALLAVIDGARSGERAAKVEGRELLASLVMGYEVATRAGIVLHATVADYHCSGAWNALGCASVAARLFGLDAARTREALGVAEYFGPRGQMMRTCDSPTMLKDGTGWGAHVGVSAGLLARDGFTGAPALTVEQEGAREWWADLGTRWRIRELYFKAYPVCRWAQPAVEAALALQRAHRFRAEDVASLAVESFREAVALGVARAVAVTTEDAQYALRHPVAAALVFGGIGPLEVSAPRLADPRVEHLQRAMTVSEDAAFSRLFPAERWARVRVTLTDGRTLASEPAVARGSAENPLSDAELLSKYRSYAEPVLGRPRAARIEHAVHRLSAERTDLAELLDDLLQPTPS